jgi:zinc protease
MLIVKRIFSWLFIIFLIGIGACKAIEPVTQTEEKKLKKFEAISENDIIQGVTFADLQNDERVVTGILPNGMTYYIMKNAKPENRAELRLVVKAGSIDEDYNQKGLAHFIEHMAFNGTKNFSKNELVDYLESVGSQFGADINAYTSFDETVYKLQVRTDDEDQLKTGFLVLSDWSSGLTFDEEEIEKERGVVISEWRTRLSAAQRMQNEYLPILLKGSRYAERLPIGDPEIIQTADPATIKQFYYQWYRPDLMAVVAVGDFNVNLIEDYISEYFSDVPKAINPRKKKSFNIGQHENTLIKICTDPEAPHTEIRVVNKMAQDIVRTTGDFRQNLISDLFVEMMSARYGELAQTEKAPFLYAGCFKGKNIGPMDAYSSFAFSKDGGAVTALKSIIRENKRVKIHGFTESELTRSKANMMRAAKLAFLEKDKSDSGGLAKLYIQNFLNASPYLSQESFYDLVKKYLPTIKLAEVNSKSNWFKDSNRVVIITGPEKDGVQMPSNRAVLEAFEDVEAEKIEAYIDEMSDEDILELKPSPAEIISSDVDEATGIENYVLGNGARVVIKPTDFSNNEILFRAIAKGGSDCFDSDVAISASHVPWIIEDSGLANFSANELKKKLTGKNIEITPYVGLLNRGLSGECGVEEAQLMAQLIYLYFSDVREDSVAFTSFKNKMVSYYGNLLSDPSYFFHNSVARISTGGNTRRMVPTAEQMEKLDMKVAFGAFRSMFRDPSEFTFVFSGNIHEQTKDVLLAFINAIPSGQFDETPVENWSFIPEAGEHVWTKGEAPKTYIDVKYYVKEDKIDLVFKEDLAAFRRLAEIKLRESLREDNGGVYGVGTYASDKLLPEGYYLFGYSFNADPGMAQELITAADDVMKELSQVEASQVDLNKVVEISRQKFSKAIKENKYWRRKVVECVTEGFPFSVLTKRHLEERLSRLTPNRMREIGHSIYNNSRTVSFRQNPE